jgi:ABC-type branched-subunit amino acid transport system substrate-binding protein
MTADSNNETYGLIHSQEESSMMNDADANVIRLAAHFDTGNHPWAPEMFDFIVGLLNNRTDGWFDDIFDTDDGDDTYTNDNLRIEYDWADTYCDGTHAARAYWSIRSQHGGIPPMGIVGARCTDDSIAIATLAGLEGVPQISPSSTGAELSNKVEYPFFHRMVPPDDEQGQVGAIIAMLKFFQWDRVGIISTDTTYAQGLATQFKKNFRGEIAYSNTITLQENNSLDEESLVKVLKEVPTDNPRQNSRIILLFAHEQHAYPILKSAKETSFLPKDTIWVGAEAWTGRLPRDDFTLDNFHEGYLGVTPYRNRDPVAQDFLERLQAKQRADRQPVSSELPGYPTEQLVDSVVAMTMALARVPPESRRNGTLVSSKLRALQFNGVNGPVALTPKGDRANPQFTILNAQVDTKAGNGALKWVEVGSTGVYPGSTELGAKGIPGLCFPVVGCGLDRVPSYQYSIPFDPFFILVTVVPITVLFLLVLTAMIKFFTQSKNKLKANNIRLMKANEDHEKSSRRTEKTD